jgi:sugar/nucleoside kinase (ribokinase family)
MATNMKGKKLWLSFLLAFVLIGLFEYQQLFAQENTERHQILIATNVNSHSVLCLGNIFYDQTALVTDKFLEENNLKKGSTTIIDDKEVIKAIWNNITTEKSNALTFGGSGANVAKFLAALGNKCALYGKYGKGDREEITAFLSEVGITSFLTEGENSTGQVACLVTYDAERTMLTLLGSSTEFGDEEVKESMFPDFELVHLEGYGVLSGDTLEKSIAFAKKYNAKVSIDLANFSLVTSFKNKFQKCIALVDIVFGNAEEMHALTGIKSPKEAIESSFFASNQIVVVTEGSKGCWVKGSGEVEAVHYDALPVPRVIDSTGAGDCFSSGFLDALLKGKKIPQCVETGNLVASYVIQVLGTDLSAAKRKELALNVEKIK